MKWYVAQVFQPRPSRPIALPTDDLAVRMLYSRLQGSGY